MDELNTDTILDALSDSMTLFNRQTLFRTITDSETQRAAIKLYLVSPFQREIMCIHNLTVESIQLGDYPPKKKDVVNSIISAWNNRLAIPEFFPDAFDFSNYDLETKELCP